MTDSGANTSEPTQICRGFTDADWIKLLPDLNNGDEAAWVLGVKVFERRMNERFLGCIEALMDADSRNDVVGIVGDASERPILPEDNGQRVVVPGFAIMALCCLLAETLQSFRLEQKNPAPPIGPCSFPAGKCVRSGTTTTDHFKEFLKRPAFGGAFTDDKFTKSFIHGIRNGILHEAETRNWVIWRDRPSGSVVGRRGEGYAVNRSAFYRALKCEFDTYLRELGDTKNADLRTRFVKKMTDIAKEC